MIEDYKEYLEQYYNYSEETKTAFIFVFGDTPEGAGGMVRKGDMPIGHQWGFIFGGMDSRTLAHELGHGLFTLRHTFDKDYGLEAQSTDNLMDYAGGSELIKYQWDILHDPARLGAPFQRDREGALSNVLVNNDFTVLFNHVHKNHNRTNTQYEDQIEEALNKTTKPETIDLTLDERERFELTSVQKEFMAQWKLRVLDADKEKIEHVYCDENYSDYLIIGFYEAEKEEPSLIIQVDKSGHDDWISAKKEWLKYLGLYKVYPKFEISESDIQELFPTTDKTKVKQFTDAVNEYSAFFEINSLERMSHFLGQVAVETGELRSLHESKGYSSPRRIVKTFPPAKYGHLYEKAVLQDTSYSYEPVNFITCKCVNDPHNGCKRVGFGFGVGCAKKREVVAFFCLVKSFLSLLSALSDVFLW